jgi:putative drug exporter of the RND superfamily
MNGSSQHQNSGTGSPIFAAIARTVIAHPWYTIMSWLVGVGIVLALAPSLATYTTGNNQKFLPNSFESVQAQSVGNKYFPAQSGGTGALVVSRQDGHPLSKADQTKASDLAISLQNDKIPGVVSVKFGPGSVASNDSVATIQLAFAGQPGDEQVNAAVGTVRTKADAFLAGSGLNDGLTGNAAIQVDTTNAYDHANKIITIATVLLIFVLLGLIFRSLIIALLPIVVIGLVHSAVSGIAAWLAEAFGFQVGNQLTSLLVVVLFGIGTDYIVFLLFRYREQLRRGVAHKEALIFSCAVVGKVVASSALTVIGAFAALSLAKLGSLSTLAPGLMVAVATMLVTALTLVPAIMSLLGRFLFWPGGHGKLSEKNAFAKEGSLVARHPGLVAGVLVIVLGGLAFATTGWTPTYNTLAELPANTPSQIAYNTLVRGFPAGALAPTQVYVVGTAPISQSSLSTLTTNLTKTPGVAQVAPPQVSTASPNAALVNVVLKDDPYSNAALNAVENSVRPTAHDSAPGDQVLVGGQTSTFVDVRSQLESDFHLVLPVALAIIAVILALLLGAVAAPISLLVCVMLAFLATLGASVLLFLHGLGYDGIDFTLPIVLFIFVVAIGTDYNILLASRLREEFRNGFSPRESARIAIANDAPTVAAAGIILALTFASLMLAGIANLTELGFGVAVGIVIAAFGMAPLLVPALSALEGRVFWWPRRAPKVSAPPSPDGVESPTPLKKTPQPLTPVSVSGAMRAQAYRQPPTQAKWPLR